MWRKEGRKEGVFIPLLLSHVSGIQTKGKSHNLSAA